MKPTALALVLALVAGPAFAHSCPKEMRAIDAALPNAKLTDAQMSEVKKLRADGETFHKQGKHDESMAALGKAKGILGIK
ncbi:MAG TPA: hypothetical protein VNU64_12705 [Burkholderiales bacterium]|jgi:hypothetical protein|nr:hypothetical protein [Burkholderiales bacterium]